MLSKITGVSIVCSTDSHQRKHQSSASLVFVRVIHRWHVDSPHKGPVRWKMFPFEDVIMRRSNVTPYITYYILTIGKTPVRIILWCPTTKMLIKACFLIQPLEQEGGCQKCCISLCSKVFINHFYQMKASPECLNILVLKWILDRETQKNLKKKSLNRNILSRDIYIYIYIDFATIFYIKLPTSTAALLVVNSMIH